MAFLLFTKLIKFITKKIFLGETLNRKTKKKNKEKEAFFVKSHHFYVYDFAER